MANTLLTIKDITREALAVLHEEVQLAKHATRKFEDRFGKKSGQIGLSLDIRKPPKYSVGTTADITALNGDTVEDYVTLSVTTRRNVKMTFSSEDLSLKINDFSKQFVRPALARLAREIDLVGFGVLKTAANSRVAHDVSTDLAFADYLAMNAKLTQQLANENDRTLFADATTMAAVVNANKGLFQAAAEIGKQYEKGLMGISGGFDWIGTQSAGYLNYAATPITTIGTVTASLVPVGSVTYEGANVINFSGATASATMVAGQGFTIPGVYAIDPETQLQLPNLYTFIAAADAVSTTGGVLAVTVGAPIYTVAGSGRTKANVSALPLVGATGAALTETGIVASKTSPLAFGIQQDTLALGVIGLEVPGGVDMGASENFEGLGVRIIRVYDVNLDIWTCRVDVQFGWAVLRNELLTSIVGKQG